MVLMTKIEWADSVWNPVTGCGKISPGCQNCYAERMSKRLAGRCGYPKENPFKVTLHPDRLEQPYNWKKPKRIFVCSMADLFHEDVPDDFIDKVFTVMAHAQWFYGHKFMVLTKRPERMRQFILEVEKDINQQKIPKKNPDGTTTHKITFAFPLQNIWLGVTAENQEQADKRIPVLLQIPAAVRFVSVEPMLGPVDLTDIHYDSITAIDALNGLHGFPKPHADGPKLDWVICGGETGPGARPMHPDWAKSLRDQCRTAGVPFFFKQWGEYIHTSIEESEPFIDIDREYDDSDYFIKVGKKNTGRLLDGRTWDEFPVIPNV